MNTLRRIETVVAEPGYRLRVTWRDGGQDAIDLGEIIHGSPVFAPLADEAAFSAVQVADYGSGVEWQNGLDYSADSLAHLALKQGDPPRSTGARHP